MRAQVFRCDKSRWISSAGVEYTKLTLPHCIAGFKLFSWFNTLRVFIAHDCAPPLGTFVSGVYDVEIRLTQHPMCYHTGNLHEARLIWNDAMLQTCLDRMMDGGYVLSECTPHGLRFVLVHAAPSTSGLNKRHPRVNSTDV